MSSWAYNCSFHCLSLCVFPYLSLALSANPCASLRGLRKVTRADMRHRSSWSMHSGISDQRLIDFLCSGVVAPWRSAFVAWLFLHLLLGSQRSTEKSTLSSCSRSIITTSSCSCRSCCYYCCCLRISWCCCSSHPALNGCCSHLFLYAQIPKVEVEMETQAQMTIYWVS